MSISRRHIALFLSIIIAVHSMAQRKGIKISPNRRFLTTENGAPFFWLGDTGWLLFSKLTKEQAALYLEDRRKKGFNVIQAMVLHNVSAVNVYGDSALLNKNVGTPLVTQGSSFADDTQYDYWDHVDYIIDLAAKKNLYMALVPVWGSNVKAGLVSQSEAEAYTAWLANRYKNNWNIVWLNGGDIRGSDSMSTWNIMGKTLRNNDPHHLITFHPFGRTSSSQWFHDAAWLDFNMFQSGHRSYDLDTSKNEHRFGPDNYRFLHIDYNLKPTKPSLDGEPSYELIPYGLHDTTKPYWQPHDVRRYAYWAVFAGGAGHTYGHNSIMQMHKPTDIGSAYGSKKFWYDALDDDGGRQMKYLKDLILSKPFFERVPDQSLIADNQGEKYRYIAATRGKEYAFIYDYTGRAFKVAMGKIKGKKVKVSWFDPRNGNKTLLGPFPNRGIIDFNPPGEEKEGNDWVLVIETIK
jgi:hypothetical protein